LECEDLECPTREVKNNTQCLGKNICKLLIGGNKTGTNISEKNGIPKKMTIYFSVLGSIMKNWILRYVRAT